MPYPIRGTLSVGTPQQLGQGYHRQSLGEGILRNAHSMPAPSGDRLEISGAGRALGNLLRTWETLSWLFGRRTPQGAGPLPDLQALRAALAEARKNLETMRTRQGIMDTLKNSALQQAEALVEKAYGLKGDGAPLRVVFEQEMGGALAAVRFQYDRQGRMANQELHLSMNQFVPDWGPNGTNQHIIENDRIVAHEITHAIMGRNLDMRSLPDWFAEGTAEYVSGGAERVSIVLKRFSPQQVMKRLTQPWEGDTTQYAAGYIAVRYLDHATRDGGGIKAIMGRLKEGASLDEALRSVSGGAFASTRSLIERVVNGAGVEFMRSIDLSGKDPGSIRQARGPDVVPDHGTRSTQPLKGFQVEWPSPLEGLNLGRAAAWGGPAAAWGTAVAYRRHQCPVTTVQV